MRRKLVSAIDGIRNLHLKTGDEEEYELEVEEKAATQHFALANVRTLFTKCPKIVS